MCRAYVRTCVYGWYDHSAGCVRTQTTARSEVCVPIVTSIPHATCTGLGTTYDGRNFFCTIRGDVIIRSQSLSKTFLLNDCHEMLLNKIVCQKYSTVIKQAALKNEGKRRSLFLINSKWLSWSLLFLTQVCTKNTLVVNYIQLTVIILLQF